MSKIIRIEPTKLGAAIDEYIAVRSSESGPWKPNTTRANKHHLGHLRDWFGAETYVHNITAKLVERAFMLPAGPVLKRRRNNAGPKKPWTISTIKGCWSSFFDYCQGCLWTGIDPMRLIKISTPQPDSDRLIISIPEMWDVIDQATFPPHIAMMVMQATTALRISEVQGVKYSGLHLDGQYMMVPIYKTSAKNKVIMEKVPVTEELDEALRLWLPTYSNQVGRLRGDYPLIPAMAHRLRWVRPDPDGPAQQETFWQVSYSGGMPKTGVNGSEIVKRYLSNARPEWNIDGEASHVFRRSPGRAFFELLADGGYARALEATARFLHHSSMTTTERYLGLGAGRRTVMETLQGQPFLRRPDMGNVRALTRAGVGFSG